MPSAATIVQDIVNQSITEIGRFPGQGSRGILVSYEINKAHQVRMGYGPFKCDFEGVKVHFSANKMVHQVDGTFAEFDDEKSVVAVMDHNTKIAVSGFFSGCEWQIYKVKPAVYYCVHVPRSSGKPDYWTGLMTQYAPTANWQLLAAYPSRGAAQVTGETVWFVSQLLPNRRIDTVRIVMSAVSGTDFGQGVRPRIARTEHYSVDAS